MIFRLFALATLIVLLISLAAYGWGTAEEAWDLERHNKFAAAYNDYIAQRHSGIVDLPTIRRMRKAWAELEKNAGWPR